MASLTRSTAPLTRSLRFRVLIATSPNAHQRFQSTTRSFGPRNDHYALPLTHFAAASSQHASPITRLPSWHLVRNIMLSAFLTNPLLLKPGLSFMKRIAESTSAFLNPDRNLILKAMIKPVVYDHFCAGTDLVEVQQTVSDIKKLGFTGVVLSFNKEISVSSQNELLGGSKGRNAEIESWRDRNLQSLDMLNSGNWLGLKFTGAGKEVVEALVNKRSPPPAFTAAIQAICERAKLRQCRMWIDAEQQAVQPGIDQWTIPLMRKYNIEGHALVYNTVQAYLKESRQKLKYQLDLAGREGWILGVKLVRGAYIDNDLRSLIHDTKADTDASYDGIVDDLLRGCFDGAPARKLESLNLFLAGHNSNTIRKALSLARDLSDHGQLAVMPEFGQLQGMADDIGCEIIEWGESEQERHKKGNHTQAYVPKVYKCLHWGSVQVSMQYLVRRAVENSAAVDRMKESAATSKRELLRRFVPDVFRKQSLV